MASPGYIVIGPFPSIYLQRRYGIGPEVGSRKGGRKERRKGGEEGFLWNLFSD